MEKFTVVSLHPDLIINKESAIDRMGATASRSAEGKRPNYEKQIQLVRRQAKVLCPAYRNCRAEDWCWHCDSGQDGKPLTLGVICRGCKLLTADVIARSKSALISIQTASQVDANGAEAQS